MGLCTEVVEEENRAHDGSSRLLQMKWIRMLANKRPVRSEEMRAGLKPKACRSSAISD